MAMSRSKKFDAQIMNLRNALTAYEKDLLSRLSHDEKQKVIISQFQGNTSLKEIREIEELKKIATDWIRSKQTEDDLTRAEKALAAFIIPDSLKSRGAKNLLKTLQEVSPPTVSQRLTAILTHPDPFNLLKYPKQASDHFVEMGAAGITVKDICKFLTESKENAAHTFKVFKRNPGSETFATNWRKELLNNSSLLVEFLNTPPPVGDLIRRGMVEAELHESKYMKGWLLERKMLFCSAKSYHCTDSQRESGESPGKSSRGITTR